MRGICVVLCHFFLLSFLDYNMTSRVLYGDSPNISNLNIDGHQGTIKHKVYSDTYKEIQQGMESHHHEGKNKEGNRQKWNGKMGLIKRRVIKGQEHGFLALF
jgi:hypothetical protein